ncbi:hypothetical protein MKZ38_000687 [Zalerion maritima]|uniref:Myb-like DNA-binding domain-containing protein n=1 Tax=Zalerion maritima TaxID=339359 RepID=A0AAD5WRX9_9PEZI|nr:hypothetical protein MKZ38_000687 [Zalerion maritima]
MSNNDNAMTRFLFAILKQKNLKDIDWNKVAHDPILAQEITNGHAARMRYSRFRSAMLGLEPQRRNRTNKDKNKVVKPKKEPKARRGNSEEATIKGEPEHLIDSDRVKPDPEPLTTARIKQEGAAQAVAHSHSPAQQLRYESQFLLTPEASVQQHSQPRDEIHHRLLTPSSDSDILYSHNQAATTANVVTGSPESLMSVPTCGFDLAAPTITTAAGVPCGHPDQASSWQITPSQGYSTNFDAAFYPPPSSGSSCEHQPQSSPHQHHHDDLSSIMSRHHTPTIKHEGWESHFPPV